MAMNMFTKIKFINSIMRSSILKCYVFLSFIMIYSCSSDDNPEITPFTNADVVGQWVLLQLNLNPNVDIGNDGPTDTILMLQTTCFDGWGLNFDAKGTLTTDSADIEIDPNTIATFIYTPRTDTGTCGRRKQCDRFDYSKWCC